MSLCCVPASGGAACRTDINGEVGGYVRVYGNVEESVCQSLLAAIRKVPKPHRKHLNKLQVVRMESPPGPPAVALLDRLSAATVLVSYHRAAHTLVVTNAGMRGEARWWGGRVPAAQMQALLTELGGNWTDMVSRAKAPRGTPLGDASVLDALLKSGTERLWGGSLTRESALLHALGQAVYLAPREANDLARRKRTWMALSHWIDTEDDGANARFGRASAEERVRAVFDIGHAPHPRFSHRGNGFVSPLARLSPRADFGESYRVAVERPDTLGSLSPAKLLVTGMPGLARDQMVAGVYALSSPPPDSPLQAWDVVAVLRERAAELEAMVAALPAYDPAASNEPIPDSRYVVALGDRILHPDRAFIARSERAALVRRRLQGELWRPPASVVTAVKAAELEEAGAAKQIEAAVADVHAIHEPARRAAPLARLAVAWGRIGEHRRAAELLSAVEDPVLGPFERARAYVDLARDRIETGEWTPIAALLGSGLDEAQQVVAAELRSDAIARVARAYSEAGLHAEGLALLEQVGEPAQRVGVRADIASWLAIEGQTARARQVFAQAAAEAAGLQHRADRIRAAIGLTACEARLDGLDQTLARLARLSPSEEAQAVGHLALTFGEEGLWQRLSRVTDPERLTRVATVLGRLDKALAAEPRIRGDWARGDAASRLARRLVARDRPVDAIKLAESISPIFRTGVDARGAAALHLAEDGKFRAAHKAARGISDPFHQQRVQRRIAQLQQANDSVKPRRRRGKRRGKRGRKRRR